jgi:hypothetical protein
LRSVSSWKRVCIDRKIQQSRTNVNNTKGHCTTHLFIHFPNGAYEGIIAGLQRAFQPRSLLHHRRDLRVQLLLLLRSVRDKGLSRCALVT